MDSYRPNSSARPTFPRGRLQGGLFSRNRNINGDGYINDVVHGRGNGNNNGNSIFNHASASGWRGCVIVYDVFGRSHIVHVVGYPGVLMGRSALCTDLTAWPDEYTLDAANMVSCEEEHLKNLINHSGTQWYLAISPIEPNIVFNECIADMAANRSTLIVPFPKGGGTLSIMAVEIKGSTELVAVFIPFLLDPRGRPTCMPSTAAMRTPHQLIQPSSNPPPAPVQRPPPRYPPAAQTDDPPLARRHMDSILSSSWASHPHSHASSSASKGLHTSNPGALASADFWGRRDFSRKIPPTPPRASASNINNINENSFSIWDHSSSAPNRNIWQDGEETPPPPPHVPPVTLQSLRTPHAPPATIHDGNPRHVPPAILHNLHNAIPMHMPKRNAFLKSTSRHRSGPSQPKQIWRGTLVFLGAVRELKISAHAISKSVSQGDENEWPNTIICDSKHVVPLSRIHEILKSNLQEWFAVFLPSPSSIPSSTRTTPIVPTMDTIKMQQLATSMKQRMVAFVVPMKFHALILYSPCETNDRIIAVSVANDN